jgi:hypothetical protein
MFPDFKICIVHKPLKNIYLFAKSKLVIGQFPPGLVFAFLIVHISIVNDQWFVDAFYKGMLDRL